MIELPSAHSRRRSENCRGLVVVVGRAVFGLHEPAGGAECRRCPGCSRRRRRRTSPCGVEAVGMQARRPTANSAGQGRARPIPSRLAGIDVGEHVRGYQIAEARTRSPRILQLHRCQSSPARSAMMPLHAAKLAIAENAEHPPAVDLPVITRTDGTEPTVATLALFDAESASALAGDLTPVSASQTPPPAPPKM